MRLVPTRLTSQGDYRYFVNTWSSYSHPYVFTVRSNKGKLIKTLEDNKELLEKTRKYNWGKREDFPLSPLPKV